MQTAECATENLFRPTANTLGNCVKISKAGFEESEGKNASDCVTTGSATFMHFLSGEKWEKHMELAKFAAVHLVF